LEAALDPQAHSAAFWAAVAVAAFLPRSAGFLAAADAGDSVVRLAAFWGAVAAVASLALWVDFSAAAVRRGQAAH
jgi:hypothetical protein